MGLTTWGMGNTFFLGTSFREEGSQRNRTSGLSLLTAGGGDPVSMVITYREAKREYDGGRRLRIG